MKRLVKCNTCGKDIDEIEDPFDNKKFHIEPIVCESCKALNLIAFGPDDKVREFIRNKNKI